MAMYMLAGEWHSNRFEHRCHMLMFRHRPTLLVGGGQKKKEVYHNEALPLLIALLEESAAMSKEDFLNELSSRALNTSVFGDGQPAEYTDDTTDAEAE